MQSANISRLMNKKSMINKKTNKKRHKITKKTMSRYLVSRLASKTKPTRSALILNTYAKSKKEESIEKKEAGTSSRQSGLCVADWAGTAVGPAPPPGVVVSAAAPRASLLPPFLFVLFFKFILLWFNRVVPEFAPAFAGPLRRHPSRISSYWFLLLS